MFRTLLCTALLSVVCLHAEKKIIIRPEFAGAPGAPAPMFSPGILVDGTFHVAGQIGADLKTNAIPDSFEDEVKLCLDRIAIVLKAAGMTFKDAIAVQVYLTDMELFPRMNSVYASVLPAPRPARTTVGVTKLAAAESAHRDHRHRPQVARRASNGSSPRRAPMAVLPPCSSPPH